MVIVKKSVILKHERNYRLSSLKFFLLHLLNPSLERFAARKATAEGRRADKGALSRLIYILRLTTASSYEEREKSRETRQINSLGSRAFALARAGEIYQNSRQQ